MRLKSADLDLSEYQQFNMNVSLGNSKIINEEDEQSDKSIKNNLPGESMEPDFLNLNESGYSKAKRSMAVREILANSTVRIETSF